MIPHAVSSLPGDMSGFPLSMPFGLFPSITSSHGMHMENETDAANLTALYATVRNMTAVEIVTSVQSFLLASLMRQYMFNDFFAGGLGLMLIGLLGTQFQRLWNKLVTWLTVTEGPVHIRILQDSELYQWMQDWLQQFGSCSSSHYDVSCVWGDNDSDNDRDSDEDRPKVNFRPEFKTAQKVTFKNEEIWVQSSKQMNATGRGGGDDSILQLLKGAGSRDDLVLSATSKKVLEEAVHAAIDLYFKKEEESRTTSVYQWSCGGVYWFAIGSRKARPIDSVILDCDPSALLDDAKKFLTSEAWYADRGIPHRRGYLLYGPPGCGKTSLIKAMASELKLDVALISLSSKELSDDTLQSAMNQMPTKSIFVLEDVDAAFCKEPEVLSSSASDDGVSARLGNTKNNLSFSGLLNAIDGITAQEGNIVVMTTNHIDKLDAALIRPGRIDMRLCLGLASTTQACGIFGRFYPDATPEQEAKVAAVVPPGVVSPASLQGLFLEHRDDLAGMLMRLPSFIAEAKSRGKPKRETGSKQTSPQPQEEVEGPAVDERRKKEKKIRKSKDRRRGTAAMAVEQEEITEDLASSQGSGENARLGRSNEGGEMVGWEAVTRTSKEGSI